MTMGISNAILELATLGFLGIGAKPPTPELVLCYLNHVALCRRQTGWLPFQVLVILSLF